ncbi:MAG: GDP-mannose 4,6-dehydratase, partial [Alteraurantiacibacter sp. bin_em_oilr2.035]|nr:GDP-mannose 4,6-dehydratase [Alteraurantiacibacter sp. bin_em_oilr2.035]
MANLLITGGAGFIGGNFVHYWAQNHPDDTMVVLDCLTYAGNESTIAGVEQAELIKGDIRDTDLVEKLLREREIATLIHFAAESHVD